MKAPSKLGAAGRVLCAALSLGTIASCAHARGRTALGPPPALPEPRRVTRPVPLPEWYWEPVDADVRAASKVVELPVPEASLVRVEGATRIWEDLGASGRERLSRDGVVVVPVRAAAPAASLHMGAFYMDVREQRIPYLVTLDALVFAVHVAFERALAEVDEQVLAPTLDTLLLKLEARLGAEQRGAGVELGEALKLARGVVAVARGLVDGTPPPVDLGAAVGPDIAAEIALVKAHAGRAHSPLLGINVDYARFVVPEAAGRPGACRAMTWLASAPLSFLAKSEMRGAPAGVATARLHTRAAMLLARVTEREVDPQINAAWSRIARLSTFVWGPADDLSPPELSQIAASMGVALADPKHIANVVIVDRFRRRVAMGRPPQVYDGSGAPGQAGIAMRLFGGYAASDARALTSLVSAPVAGRSLPSTLDLAAWLEASEARAALHESGADGATGFEDALTRAIASRPSEDAPSRHASLQGSLLDVVMAWLAPRTEARGVWSPAVARAAIESGLAAWTLARHEGHPLSRARPSSSAHAPRELAVTGAALPAFVEEAPEVIARLVATVGQMKRGLGAVGGLTATSPAMTSLAEVDDILRVALRVATRETNDEALGPEDVAALASLPARLSRLEEGDDGALAKVPLVAEIFADGGGDRALSSATGLVEQAIAIVREPGTGRLVVAVGAHVSHYELVEPRAHRSTDISHASRLAARGEKNDGTALIRGAYTGAFRVVHGGAAHAIR